MHTKLTKTELTRLKSLHTPKGRLETGAFLIEGEKGVQEAIKSGWPLKQILVDIKLAPRFTDLDNSLVIDSETMAKISGVKTSPGIMAEALISDHLNQNAPKGNIVVCCGIADPGNLGTIIRTADWFGIALVLVSNDSVDIYNEKVVRSSMGSFFNLAVKQSQSLQADLLNLKTAGYSVIASQAEGGQTEFPGGLICLLLGSESHGIPPEISALADGIITIPKSPYAKNAESLNVGVSGGILLSKISSQ